MWGWGVGFKHIYCLDNYKCNKLTDLAIILLLYGSLQSIPRILASIRISRGQSIVKTEPLHNHIPTNCLHSVWSNSWYVTCLSLNDTS